MSRFTHCRGCGYSFTFAELRGDDYCSDKCRDGVRYNADGTVRNIPAGYRPARPPPGLLLPSMKTYFVELIPPGDVDGR